MKWSCHGNVTFKIASCINLHLILNCILPGGVPLSRDVSPTTIGAGELNCCVRHGNRWGLSAIATGQYGALPESNHV